MNQEPPSIENPYDNESALKELLKMMKRKEKITVSYVVDKYGYASAKLDSKTIAVPFNLQMSEELYNWLIDGYLINGEIREPIPSPNKDLLKNLASNSNELATNTLINYINRVGFRLHMRVTPEIADKSNKLTVMFGFQHGIIVFKVNREKEILEELASIDY